MSARSAPSCSSSSCPTAPSRCWSRAAAARKITSFAENDAFFQAYAEVVPEPNEDPKDLEALARSVVSQFEQYIKLNKKIPPEVLVSLNQIDDPSKLADTVASHLALKIADKQELLETERVGARLERAYSYMESEIGVLQVEKRIRNRVKRQMEKTQREYYLNEQLKAIQKELGEGEEGRDEAGELEERIKKTRLTKEAHEKAMAELKKLRSMSPMSAEATVVRNYLDWMLSIPWKSRTRVKRDIKWAEHVLNDDHYGLEKVKERIVEYLAVQQRVKKIKGPILCLVGPPGVGKTSLGRSVAKATGRNFVRMSLGGVRDEAEIRGHRRTYIGSMPGKIIQSMKKAKSSNPLFLLDEIDKIGADWRGDPSSALLEVLDPEQNYSFNDHYLEVDYDLSDVMFVTTANTLRIPQPLLDRMEVIRIPGYTEDEKIEIAKRHLLPKQLKDHGLKKGEWHDLRRRAARPDPLLHARGRRAEPRARDRQPGPQGGARGGGRQDRPGARHGAQPRQVCRRAPVPLRRGRGRRSGGRGHGPRLDRGRRRAAVDRGGHHARQGQRLPHRQARRRDAGIGPGRAVLYPLALGRVRHQARPGSRSATSTSTFPRARRPRTGRRRASPCARRSSRR